MSIKKALDLISEKFSHLLPSAAAIEAAVVAVREEGPLDARIILCLDEGEPTISQTWARASTPSL